MKDYFNLHYLRTKRKLMEAGLNPLLVFLFGLIVFVLISEYLFQRTEFAKYLLFLACLSLLFKLSERNRTDFLRSTFGDKRKRNMRVIENLIVCLPFVIILLFKHAFLESALLFVVSVISAAFSFQTNFSITIPTPFSRNPFEFTIGFRKTFFIFPVVYALAIIAIYVDNLNLGIFSMLLLFLTALTYFTKPEDEYYVWVHSDTPKRFLAKKISAATKNVCILTIPILLLLLMFFTSKFDLILLFFLIGFLFVWTIILAKYSAYPGEMNLAEGIFIAFSISFPPLLLAIIPFFYSKSLNNLKLILNDKN